MNKFNEEEYKLICKRFNTSPAPREITLRHDTPDYFNKVKEAVKSDRRGEVVFCVTRPNGKIISITCEEYPEGIFRIPTGGIGHDEDVIEAVTREVKEELGLDTEITEFAGVLKLRFECENDFEMFYSYIFILKETGGKLLEDATDDEVSEVMEVDLKGLAEVADKLLGITGRWAPWGRFRYETTHAVFTYLKDRGYYLENSFIQ